MQTVIGKLVGTVSTLLSVAPQGRDPSAFKPHALEAAPTVHKHCSSRLISKEAVPAGLYRGSMSPHHCLGASRGCTQIHRPSLNSLLLGCLSSPDCQKLCPVGPGRAGWLLGLSGSGVHHLVLSGPLLYSGNDYLSEATSNMSGEQSAC